MIISTSVMLFAVSTSNLLHTKELKNAASIFSIFTTLLPSYIHKYKYTMGVYAVYHSQKRTNELRIWEFLNPKEFLKHFKDFSRIFMDFSDIEGLYRF